jgi:succinate dehydrogenase / fumarate reductase flavoprotein subunit
MQASLAKLENSRQDRMRQVIDRLTIDEALELVQTYHPDYIDTAKRKLRVGPNKREAVPHEAADILEGRGYINPVGFELTEVDYDTDVLVLGGGGAGSTAALFAQQQGARVLLATKLRHGDSNTIMAEGGMAAVSRANDSPMRHYLDTVGGGKFENVPELVKALVLDAPIVVRELAALGVLFDRAHDGTHLAGLTGGHSRARLHSCKDYTGLEIMRVIRDEVHSRGIQVLEFNAAVELLLDEKGQCAGAILMNLETDRCSVVRARTVIIATGGLGRLHIQAFPTTNHYGATADGLVMAYRAGARLLHLESVQYHPTGTAWPEQMFGWLVTELFRGYGAQLVNGEGDRFINELESRDVAASAIIRECERRCTGVETPSGMTGIWLDTPLVELLNGEGTVERIFTGCFRRFMQHGIDIRTEPVLVYPTQHYQNGGLMINAHAETTLPNLYAAGEVCGGVHGRNRLGGNSLAEVFVFGRRAGINAAAKAKEAQLGQLTLQHVRDYRDQLESLGGASDLISPLLLPDYVGPTRFQRYS